MKTSPRVTLAAIGLGTLLFAPAAALAGTWQPLVNQPPSPEIFDPDTGADLGPGGAASPLLLTDGRVLVQNIGSAADGRIFALTPDDSGSYVNGTWSELAPLPYIPTDNAQAVLPDGRAIIIGGEYTGRQFDFTLTNQGAIYDPAGDSWQSILGPSFFVDLYPPRAQFAPHPIGDSASVVLADGTFMVADKMSRQAALLDAGRLVWTETGTRTKLDLNDEEGWTLLPSGKVLTVDCYTDFFFGLAKAYPKDPTGSELYDPKRGEWKFAGSTINTLTDPDLSEVGPAVLRPDGTVLAVGSQGFTSIYDSRKGKWSVGPRFPISPQGFQYTAQDAPGALLPSGNVLLAVSGGAAQPGNYSAPPVAFFEFDGEHLIAEPTIPNGPFDQAYYLNFLVLPTGQILEADSSGDVEIYTPDDLGHDEDWQPEIHQHPDRVSPGKTYRLKGRRFNGMSQGAMYGDEGQSATNYPLVRLTHLRTGHVRYSRTHDHSSMAVASDEPVTTWFDVPVAQERGRSRLEVVANGIASKAVEIDVR